MRRALVVSAALFALATPLVASGANVRPDRPRLLVSNGTSIGATVAQIQARCADPSYKGCASSLGSPDGLFPAMAMAARYLVQGDPAACTDAFTKLQDVAKDTPGQPDPHSYVSNNGRTAIQLASVRDWCDAALSPDQKTWIESKLVEITDWYLTGQDPLDVFHDDMNNVWASVAYAGLTLKGTSEDAKADAYLAKAEEQWKTVIFPALAYEGDWWHEGMVYAQGVIGAAAMYALAWSTATDEDMFAWSATHAGDVLAGYIDFYTYAMRPDDNYAYFGDTSDNKQSIELYSRYQIDLLTTGTGSPKGQGLSLYIEANTPAYYDYAGADSWMKAFFFDSGKSGAAIDRSTLPTARWMSPGAADVAILRSGWGQDDTFVLLSCGDYFGAHQHHEAGSFQIARGGILTGPTGYYDAFDSDHWDNYYSQHSVHANTLAVHQPGELFPNGKTITGGDNVNDGGQRPLRRDKDSNAFANPDLTQYFLHKGSAPFVDTADVTAFAHDGCHDYVACEMTSAYSSPGHLMNGNSAKTTEVTRQLVFLPPELVVVFDRVESTDASYEKRFLLHTAAPPTVAGKDFTIDNGTAKLLGRTLLPASATTKVLDGFLVDGVAHPPSQSGKESGGTRLEVSPSTPSLRDYFLHVLDASHGTTAPASTVAEDDASATVTIDDGAKTYVVRFAKTGPLAGHVTVSIKGGAALCDEDLAGAPGTGGAGGSSTGAGGSGPGGSGGHAAGGTAIGAGGSSAGGSSKGGAGTSAGGHGGSLTTGHGGAVPVGGAGSGGTTLAAADSAATDAAGDSGSCGCRLGERGRAHGLTSALSIASLALLGTRLRRRRRGPR